MLHIVYRGGTPAMNDLLAGHLPLSFATVAQALQQYKAGQLRAIGISSATRYASVPEIPTFKEQGFDVVANEWYGLLAPAGTPKPIIDEAQCRDEAHHGAARHGRPACRDRADGTRRRKSSPRSSRPRPSAGAR